MCAKTISHLFSMDRSVHEASGRIYHEDQMYEYLEAVCREKDLTQTAAALPFAREQHRGQFRKSKPGHEKIPYIYHPLLMCCHAAAMGLWEDDLLAACLLHDVCEDCGVAPEELPVSETAREAVRLVTKKEGFQRTEEDEREYYDAIIDNRVAVMVKLLDRCNNVSEMVGCFTPRKIEIYREETYTYVYPLLRHAMEFYEEYAGPLFLLKYQLDSVLDGLG